MGVVIFTEGNIGSGKSTAAKHIGQRLGYRVLDEPLDRDLLSLFYEDQARWAWTLQVDFLHSRWRLQMLAACEEPGAILDRCLWGDLVFARMHMEAGNIHPMQWRSYRRALRNMCLVLFPPTILLYLATTPETCLERIRKRGRPEERNITLEYLQQVDDGYNRLLTEAKTAFYPWSHAVEVMMVPWDVDTATKREWDQTAAMIRKVVERKTLPDYLEKG